MLAFIVYKCKTERVKVGRSKDETGRGRSMAGAGKLIDRLCEAGSGLGLLWVTGGNTVGEYMFSELTRTADIVAALWSELPHNRKTCTTNALSD